MSENTKKRTVSVQSAQDGESIDAEKMAEISNPQTGDEKSFDAGSTRDKAAEFEALIENEYKKQFTDKVQKIISKRLREVKNMKEEQKMQNETREMPSQAELIGRLIEENRRLKQLHMEQLRDMEAKNKIQSWKSEAEEVKGIYPEFDLKKELSDPEFIRLLKLGVNLKSAYEVANLDSILDRNTKTAERKVVDSIRSKGNRPVENGSESAAGILLSGNVSKLNKKQRAELAKRAAKGEKISF